MGGGRLPLRPVGPNASLPAHFDVGAGALPHLLTVADPLTRCALPSMALAVGKAGHLVGASMAAIFLIFPLRIKDFRALRLLAAPDLQRRLGIFADIIDRHAHRGVDQPGVAVTERPASFSTQFGGVKNHLAGLVERLQAPAIRHRFNHPPDRVDDRSTLKSIGSKGNRRGFNRFIRFEIEPLAQLVDQVWQISGPSHGEPLSIGMREFHQP